MDDLIRAGKICKDIKKTLQKHVLVGSKLLDLANWIETEIKKKGASSSFPVNISIDNVAAHFSPPPNCVKTFEEGQLVKVDFGAQINGWASDNAVSFDLGEHNELKQASEDALSAATEILVSRGPEATLSELGSAIENAIKARGFNPITNLTGHKIEQWELHAGLSIFNYDSGSDKQIGEGIFAIEPFATTGEGRVKNGQSSEIYMLLKNKPQRMPQLKILMKEILKFKTLPFCSRWVTKPEYLKLLVRNGVLHNYPLLMEVSGGKVSQTENTFLVKENKVEIIT